MRNKVSILLMILMAPVLCFSQGWEAMDLGFKYLGSGGIEDISFDPQNGDVFVGGDMFYDGRDSIITELTKWNNLTGHWERVLPNFLVGASRHILFYDSEMYISLHNGLHKVINEDTTFFNNGPNGVVRSSLEIDDNLYLVGSFDFVGEDHSYGIAIYDGEEFVSIDIETNYPFGPRLDDIVEYNGEVYIGGKTMTGFPYYDWRGLAKLVDNDLVVVHEEFTGSFFSMRVYTLESYQDKLFIGGTFNTGLGFTGNGIQSFDGESMFSVGGGVNGHVWDMKAYQGELYVVGSFNRIGEGVMFNSNVGGEPCGGVAKWNGETWTCLNDSFPDNGFIQELEIYNDTLYIGGSFTQIGTDTTMSMIARRRIFPDTTLVGVSEVEQHSFSIYPNPAEDQFTIDFGELPIDEFTISLYNSLGEIVKKEKYSNRQQSQVVDVSALSKGLYVVTLHLGHGILSKKVLVE